MATAHSLPETSVGDLYFTDFELYKELSNSYRYLNLHLLPFEWFQFIFHGRPFSEIWDRLFFINTSLEYDYKNWDQPICPDLQHIWRWTEFCGPREVKVVILGQDPYYKVEKCEITGRFLLAADGYGFSIDKEFFSKFYRNNYIPYTMQSIINMACGPGEEYLHDCDGDLTSWCRQGVVMLDLALTTLGNQANAHKNIGWDYVTKLVIKRLGGWFEPPKVFMFWRKDFKDMFENFVDERCHLAIFSCHPSSRKTLRKKGQDPEVVKECFCRCWSNPELNCFVKANKFLAYFYGNINWNPLSRTH